MKGERLYKAARRGEVKTREARSVTVPVFEVRHDTTVAQELTFRVVCSKGTYVRSLVHDLVSGSCLLFLNLKIVCIKYYGLHSGSGLLPAL